MFFTFPEDARWNADRMAVEFGVEVGEYRGVVRIGRRVFQRMVPASPTPERCLEAYHLRRTRFEMIAERKLRRRQLTDDGNVEITGRDPREKTSPAIRDGVARVLEVHIGSRLEDQAGRRPVDEQPTFPIRNSTFCGADATPSGNELGARLRP